MNDKADSTVGDDFHQTVQKMIHLGRYHAVREGIPQAEVEDCEVTFVEHMLLRGEAHTRGTDTVRTEAWLHRCAQNHARNYRRHLLRRQGKCVSLSAMRDQAVRDQDLVDKQSPESLLMRKHLRTSIDSVVDRLVPEVRTMLLSHYVLGQTAAEIAQSSGRSAHAVEQALYRARRVVRKELSRIGVSGE